jgi:GAF domain-containing protein
LPVRLAVFGLRDSQKRLAGYGAIVQSLSEQQRLLQSLQQQARRLQAAAEVARTAISKLDLDALLLQVASVTQKRFNFDLVCILLIDENQPDALQVKVCYSSEGMIIPGDTNLPIDENSLNGWVARHGRGLMVNNVEQDARFRTIADLPPVGSELIVPLRVGDRVIGTFDIQSQSRDTFVPEDMETLQGIADQLAGAIDNTRLLEAERRQVKQLATLNAVSQMLVDAYNLEELWGPIYRQIADLLRVSTFYVMRYDPERNSTRFIYLVDNGNVLQNNREMPLGGVSKLVIVTGAPVLINNLEEQQTFLENRGTRPLLIPGARPSASWMGVPLRSRDGVVMGLVSVQSEYQNAFSERDVQLLTTIGTQISLAMENASLFTRLGDAAMQLKERAKRTETLYQIATLLSATLDQDHILSLAAEQINKLLEADHCGIVLIDQDKNVARLVAEYPESMLSRQDFTISDLSTFNELWDNDILAYVDPRNDPRLDFQRDSIVQMGIRSILIARLFAKGRLIGSIGIDMVNREHVFTPEQIEVVRTLANQLPSITPNSISRHWPPTR